MTTGGEPINDKFSLPVWSFTESQKSQARQTLENALLQVPFYQNWAKYDPGINYPVEQRYAALPALLKKDIRENFPSRMLPVTLDLSKAIETGDINLVETSGTTDDKITNIWNQKWWDASEKSSWQLNSLLSQITTGHHSEAILVNPKNVGIRSDEVDLPFEKRRLGRFLYLNEKTNPLSWSKEIMDRMIDELNSFQPVVLEANPSYLARLSRYIFLKGASVRSPQAIVFTYEYPTHFHRQQIGKVFSSPQISSYGTTETGYVFMQCEAGKMHQNSDFCHIDFQPFKSEYGGPWLGRILVTPLGNPWSYFLRFDTGDIVQLEASGQCQCGRTSGIILKAVAGRKVNLTVSLSGRPVTLLELDQVISSLQGVQEYQVVQLSTDEFNLHINSSRSDKKGLEQDATVLLKGLYGKEAKVTIIYSEGISPEDPANI